MLLRIRVRLPDRPGSLGKVARTLGAAGADVVRLSVLEQDEGRALDDFTVSWPNGLSADRLIAGLDAVPGVKVEGLWRTVEPQGLHPDVALIGQLATAPAVDGLVILADALPAILSADWAGVVHVPSGKLVHTSPGGETAEAPADLEPLRLRAFQAPDGAQYAFVPLPSADLAVLVARSNAPEFHKTEILRLEQLVLAACAVLGERLGPFA
ncbi:ACT domain-containing protein [Actinocorallia sp. API 0066]|uniref:ACT domain-containing protein n=1 Tax=Actinocorallia sp. API 0066 TaxID=2896846 RepID=UPI001E30C0B7|nr:ACT domain-containing protein [Actinocorallia sp. API 0066]MCD0448718.1 ACT domain-containing protein [Actinocorallia sp. API 0066]